jgi:hypothetical protein
MLLLLTFRYYKVQFTVLATFVLLAGRLKAGFRSGQSQPSNT